MVNAVCHLIAFAFNSSISPPRAFSCEELIGMSHWDFVISDDGTRNDVYLECRAKIVLSMYSIAAWTILFYPQVLIFTAGTIEVTFRFVLSTFGIADLFLMIATCNWWT